MKHCLTLVFSFFIFTGCSIKPETITIYKDVFVPVACKATMPKKPKNDGSFEAKKELMSYFLECESLLKGCTNASNH